MDITPVNSTQDILASILNEKVKGEKSVAGQTANFINDCDTYTYNNKTTLAVIDISSSSMKLLNQRSANTARKKKLQENKGKSKNIFTISHKPKSLDTDKYLKISSMKSQVNDRKQSSRSLINTFEQKEVLDKYPDYISLPLIKIEDSEFSGKSISASQKLKNLKQEPSHKKNDINLVLPPILTTNQFRSISATPRQMSKTFSALSMKLASHFKENKSTKLSKSCLENPVSNR